MKVLYTSDIHASSTHLFSMLSIAEKDGVEAVIIGGDIIPHSLPDPSRIGVLQTHAQYIGEVFIPSIKDFKQKRDVELKTELTL